MPLSLRYAKGYGTTSYFPLSAITDRLNARNQFHVYTINCIPECRCGMRAKRSNNRLHFSSHAKVRSTRFHSACIAVWIEKAW